jgi:hypothetical protein
MAHLQAFRAAVDGKHPGSKPDRTTDIIASARRLTFAAVAFFFASLSGTAGYAQQTGAFAGLAGNWSGGGTITLDDGSTERIRCRASYAVGAGGNGLNQTLTCASDSYKINLASNVIAQGAALSGTWTESTRNVSGALEGRAGGGQFNLVASAPGFTANIALKTQGNKQAVTITSQTVLRSVSIQMSRI